MSPIPEPLNTIGNLIDRYHESKIEQDRAHLGCSILGHECERYLWLSFRWVVKQNFSGRILRLFRRGHLEEQTVIDDLKAIGVQVAKNGKDQYWVSFGSHVSGSIDGIITNLPFAPKRVAILEIKTHSSKSFSDLVKHGLASSQPKHFIQMQVYMLGSKLERGLYYAINKDTDEIYTEWVKLDRTQAEAAVERGKRIALSDRMPEPISTNPSWYQCKMCSMHTFCHVEKIAQKVNCRTCAHSTAKEDGTWRCERYEFEPIPIEHQRTGCESHVIHPDMVPWDLDTNLSTSEIAAYKVGDKILQNGDACANVYSSKEIIENGADVCLDPIVVEAKDLFDAVIEK